MKKNLIVSMSFLLLIFSSCATILTGTKQGISIATFPPGADIEVDGISRGVTPSIVKLKKGFDGQTVTLKKEGFEIKTFQPETAFNPIAIINLFSILGWGIDAVSGSIMKYDTAPYDIKLKPLEKK